MNRNIYVVSEKQDEIFWSQSHKMFCFKKRIYFDIKVGLFIVTAKILKPRLVRLTTVEQFVCFLLSLIFIMTVPAIVRGVGGCLQFSFFLGLNLFLTNGLKFGLKSVEIWKRNIILL